MDSLIDDSANEDLNKAFSSVYEELCKLARNKVANNPQHSIQASDLLHEAYIRLSKEKPEEGINKWQDRKFFFSAAAEAMRRILVEGARARNCIKRGGELNRTDLSISKISTREDQLDMEALDSALDSLEKVHPEEAELIKLKFFVGLQWTEIAEITGESTRTVRRKWAFARAWLRDSIAFENDS